MQRNCGQREIRKVYQGKCVKYTKVPWTNRKLLHIILLNREISHSKCRGIKFFNSSILTYLIFLTFRSVSHYLTSFTSFMNHQDNQLNVQGSGTRWINIYNEVTALQWLLLGWSESGTAHLRIPDEARHEARYVRPIRLAHITLPVVGTGSFGGI